MNKKLLAVLLLTAARQASAVIDLSCQCLSPGNNVYGPYIDSAVASIVAEREKVDPNCSAQNWEGTAVCDPGRDPKVCLEDVVFKIAGVVPDCDLVDACRDAARQCASFSQKYSAITSCKLLNGNVNVGSFFAQASGSGIH